MFQPPVSSSEPEFNAAELSAIPSSAAQITRPLPQPSHAPGKPLLWASPRSYKRPRPHGTASRVHTPPRTCRAPIPAAVKTVGGVAAARDPSSAEGAP